MPRLGPRAAYNHRREPLSVSQPTHTFKFPDPAPCFWPPFLLASLSKKVPCHTRKVPPIAKPEMQRPHRRQVRNLRHAKPLTRIVAELPVERQHPHSCQRQYRLVPQTLGEPEPTASVCRRGKRDTGAIPTG